MINVPQDAKIVHDNRLTILRVIATLYDQLVEGDDGLKTKIKKTMQQKGATFAESELVIAQMRAGGAGRSTIDAAKLYKLIDAGELTVAQFLECVTVNKKPLERYLAGARIEKLATPGAAASPSLVTEFKEGVTIDVDRMVTALISTCWPRAPITSA